MFGRAAIAILLVAISAGAAAHMLPKGDATLNLKGDKGYLVVSIAASALVAVDDDQDGLLSPTEIDRHRLQIQKQFSEGFSVSSHGKSAPFNFVWVTHPDNGEERQTANDYIIVLAGVQFPRPLGSVTVKSRLYGSNVDEKQIMLTVTRGAEKQEIMLDRQQPEHEFFLGVSADGWTIWVTFIALIIIASLIFTLCRRYLNRGS